jgi:hypothetical protein
VIASRAARPLTLLPALLAAVLLAACGPSGTVEEQIRARIADMEAAGEAGERGAFMGFVADGFEAQDRAMNRDDFRRFMFLQFSRQRRVQAQVFPITVEAQGPNLATARFKVLVTGGGGLIPEDGQLFDVETQWMLDGGDWLLWRADWRPLGP